jgi:hypothetical protein
MITREDLEMAKYVPHPHHQGEFCRGFWQKIVRGPDGMKRYFINVYLWEFPRTASSEQASVEVALYRDDGLTHRDQTDLQTDFRVNLQLGNASTLAGMEGFYAELYEKLGCVPDLHNNDSEPAEPPNRFERV